MSCCKNKSGQTSVLELVPVATGTTTPSPIMYYIDLIHYLCRNRNICITAQYPLSGTMRAVLKSIDSLGGNLYSLSIQLVGSVSYLPYVCGCNNCDVCPQTDTVFTSITVPFYSTTVPTSATLTVTPNVLVSPTNVQDCCTKTNAVEIEFGLTVTSPAPAPAVAALLGEDESLANETKSSRKIGRLSEKLKCSKCISFWLTLAYSIACGGPVIRCILVSFLCALAALWIDLLLAYINKKYDRLWEDL